MESRGIKVTKTSSLYETEAMYVLDQGRFINGACEVSGTSVDEQGIDDQFLLPQEMSMWIVA